MTTPDGRQLSKESLKETCANDIAGVMKIYGLRVQHLFEDSATGK